MEALQRAWRQFYPAVLAFFAFSDGGCFWSAIWNIRNFYAGSRAHMKKACRRQALVGADGA
ncbi:MAG TPA: hypothetical protein VNZ94_14415 [Xanthobacteraceae bacterium]|nr:hypothetical protein [Xanthobacteraceae bacterium]